MPGMSAQGSLDVETNLCVIHPVVLAPSLSVAVSEAAAATAAGHTVVAA